ncbi:MAG TPA: phenylacetate--CoA ligase family protein [Armatimonadota bacterium]|nr:phenylacetate--CoA ligase family protein [Armatimonadota bacterium]
MHIARRFAWNTITKVRGNVLEHYKTLQMVAGASYKEAIEFQNHSLAKILSHAYRYVPYYWEVMADCGIVDQHGRVDLTRFSEIPLLNRATIHERHADLQSTKSDNKKRFENKSSGSTGEPVKVVWDSDVFDWIMATKILFDDWAGYQVGLPQITLWGSERDLLVGNESIKTKTGRWLRNEVCLNSFYMTPDRMHEFVNAINSHKPVHILAYAGSLYELACFIEREGLPIRSPMSIMTSADTLYPHMREKIEQVFGVRVFNRYGTRETGDIACECKEHNGLHICLPTHFVEILRPDGSPVEPGEEGEVVLTLLTNYSMPLIRYRIGDTAVQKKGFCNCGVSWPLLQHITGRLTDAFIRKDGGIVSSQTLLMILNNCVVVKDWIKKCQCIQEDYDKVCVRITSWDRNCLPQIEYASELLEVKERIKLVMGEDCEVDFEFPDDIPPTPSGKFRYVISNVER